MRTGTSCGYSSALRASPGPSSVSRSSQRGMLPSALLKRYAAGKTPSLGGWSPRASRPRAPQKVCSVSTPTRSSKGLQRFKMSTGIFENTNQLNASRLLLSPEVREPRSFRRLKFSGRVAAGTEKLRLHTECVEWICLCLLCV